MDQKAALEALEACTNHELVHSKDKNYRVCMSIGTDYFVKLATPMIYGLSSKLSRTSSTMQGLTLTLMRRASPRWCTTSETAGPSI
jgi:hypothetical protein